ncbi:MAG: DUF4258 domain-containing protein [Desulfobacterium sp.]|jgi:hypothetical protein|nr:DUF4258 domain-containing protein [Desulfobacterium sp.]
MTKEDAQKCFREFAKYGCIQPTKHCRDRMLDREVSMDDALNVLLWGTVTEMTYNDEHDSWKSKVVGKDIDGEKLTFVAEVYESCHTVRCITVF